MNPWPFKDPPNLAVIVNRKILHDGEWIAYVSHDDDDGVWQFHTDEPGPPNESDAAVVGLGKILELDETIAELADLQPGWHARRDSPTSAWQRAKNV
jgi:hypothetical protein